MNKILNRRLQTRREKAVSGKTSHLKVKNCQFIFTSKARGQKLKASILHMEIHNTFKANIDAARAAVDKAAAERPALIALPEYFTVPNCMGDFTDAKKISKETCEETLNFLQQESKQIGNIYLLGGSVLEEDRRTILQHKHPVEKRVSHCKIQKNKPYTSRNQRWCRPR